MTAHPLIHRTSPKEQPFVGTCAACGKEGLTLRDQTEGCTNPVGMTQEQALLQAIEGEDNGNN